MSLPRDPVFPILRDEVVLVWENLIATDYVGESHGYACNEVAVGTTNGAGPVNTQILVLAADGTVLHALPGFWHAEDLADELRFGLQLAALWAAPTPSVEVKRAVFAQAQLDHAAGHSLATTARSGWQGFDRKNELKRLEAGRQRDTFVFDADRSLYALDRRGDPVSKPIDLLVHERLAARPFRPLAAFDVAGFADYGREYYDNNEKVCGEGVTFMTPERVAKHEARQARDAEREAKRRAKAEAKRRKKSEEAARREAARART